MCYCVITACAYTSAGPLSLKQKRCSHICHHIGLHRLHTAHTHRVGSGAELLLLLLIHDQRLAAQEVGFDNLCEIVDGRPRGIDTLTQHMRGMVFP